MILFFQTMWTKIVKYFQYHYGVGETINNKTNELSTNITNSIKFEIDQWNRFIITIRIENANSMSCEEFGKMLYLINDGRYDQKIIEVLVELGKNHQLPVENIQQIMSGWTSILATEMDENNQPCVKPTEVFNTK